MFKNAQIVQWLYRVIYKHSRLSKLVKYGRNSQNLRISICFMPLNYELIAPLDVPKYAYCGCVQIFDLVNKAYATAFQIYDLGNATARKVFKLLKQLKYCVSSVLHYFYSIPVE